MYIKTQSNNKSLIKLTSRQLKDKDFNITPYSQGGKSTIENLKMYCKAHNQFDAIQVFGKRKMQNYLGKNSEARNKGFTDVF
jgi:hypothetical protein